MSDFFQPYPLLMEPHFSPRPWGGDRLAREFGKSLPADGGPFGESWELSDHPDGPSRVANGPAAGRLFGDLLREHPRRLLGLDRAPDRFPLLIKYIDAAESLSVQVHPDDELARPLGECGKFECWYVIDARPGARIIQGLCPGVTPDALRRAAEVGDVEPLLRNVPIRTGDVIAMPPGTVHALLGQTLICEIQRPSNITYRLFDWDRFPPRELHVEQALAATRYDAAPDPPVNIDQLTGGASLPLAPNPYFELSVLQWRPGQRGETMTFNPNGVAFNVVRGDGLLIIDHCEPQPLAAGQTWFVPAGMNRWTLEAEGNGLRLLVSRPLSFDR
jgi:mannose-6-phosphate isomerase